MSVVRKLLGTLLAVVLSCGATHAGASETDGRGSGCLRPSRTEVACRVNLLYPAPAFFLQADATRSAEALGQSDTPAPSGRTRGFWLPDSLETSWPARDKKLHLLACYSIVLTGQAATDRLETGVVWAACLSVAKELCDLWCRKPATHGGVSKGDLVADATGLVAAVIAIQAFGD